MEKRENCGKTLLDLPVLNIAIMALTNKGEWHMCTDRYSWNAPPASKILFIIHSGNQFSGDVLMSKLTREDARKNHLEQIMSDQGLERSMLSGVGHATFTAGAGFFSSLGRGTSEIILNRKVA